MRRMNAVLVVLVLLIATSVYAANIRLGKVSFGHRSWSDKVILREVGTFFSERALTASYVSSDTVIECAKYSEIELLFDITQGSLDSLEVIVYHGVDVDEDGTIEWYREQVETVAAATITWTDFVYQKVLSGDVSFFVPLPCLADYLKISVKGTDSGGIYDDNTCAVYVAGGR